MTAMSPTATLYQFTWTAKIRRIGSQWGSGVSILEDGQVVALRTTYNNNSNEVSGCTKVYTYAIAISSWVQMGNDVTGETGND